MPACLPASGCPRFCSLSLINCSVAMETTKQNRRLQFGPVTGEVGKDLCVLSLSLSLSILPCLQVVSSDITWGFLSENRIQHICYFQRHTRNPWTHEYTHTDTHRHTRNPCTHEHTHTDTHRHTRNPCTHEHTHTERTC